MSSAVNYNGAAVVVLDIPDILDCTAPATVSFGTEAACGRHASELELALRAELNERPCEPVYSGPAEPGRTCGEHLRKAAAA